MNREMLEPLSELFGMIMHLTDDETEILALEVEIFVAEAVEERAFLGFQV